MIDIFVLKKKFRLLIDRFEDSLQQSAGFFPVRIFSILYSSPHPALKVEAFGEQAGHGFA
jgi:hypothetical protein